MCLQTEIKKKKKTDESSEGENNVEKEIRKKMKVCEAALLSSMVRYF